MEKELNVFATSRTIAEIATSPPDASNRVQLEI
jgi:hypothetical protein